MLRVLRLVRVARIAKLSRHSRRLNLLMRTMGESRKELSFLFIFFGITVVIYSSIIYFIESKALCGRSNGEIYNPSFQSIPHGFWWSAVTMTTVGYGDAVPCTPTGKLIGFFCAISGVICAALPVPSIVGNFQRLTHESDLLESINNGTDDSDENYEQRTQLNQYFVAQCRNE